MRIEHSLGRAHDRKLMGLSTDTRGPFDLDLEIGVLRLSVRA